jgi:metallo-beta-lactamase family protein
MPTLTFLGAAGTVTGSKHLLDFGEHRILIDCGLFQGLKELRLRNWAAFPIDPRRIDAVVLTHAHLDHCGYLPRLVAAGFQGRVFCTAGTRDLCTLVLPDSAHLQEEDARQANRSGYSKHSPALPLYTQIDAARALDRLQPVGYQRPVPVVPGVEVEFINAGHLLGSAYARMRIGDKAVLFGGDLGRYGRPILPDPMPVDAADVVLLESTYGDRLHEPDDGGQRLAAIVNDTVARGGKLLIPSFAIGRVEEVLYGLKHLEDAQRIPILPVYVDSPMAIGALGFYRERLSELNPDLLAASGGSRAAERKLCVFCTTRMTTIASAEQSHDLVASRAPAIILAASGMATGGRVLNHLAAVLPDSRNTVLFVGYQAPGTRGRHLCDGDQSVTLHGQAVPVAARVERIDSMSAHADRAEILRWLAGFSRAPTMTYLVHGEGVALEALSQAIAAERGWPTHIAKYLERVELNLR